MLTYTLNIQAPLCTNIPALLPLCMFYGTKGKITTRYQCILPERPKLRTSHQVQNTDTEQPIFLLIGGRLVEWCNQKTGRLCLLYSWASHSEIFIQGKHMETSLQIVIHTCSQQVWCQQHKGIQFIWALQRHDKLCSYPDSGLLPSTND